MTFRFRLTIAAVLLLFVLSMSVSSLQSYAAPKQVSLPRFDGTFIQLLEYHAQWSQEDWERLFAHFRRLELSQLVIQWTVYGELAFYPSARFRSISSPPLEEILRLADESGMRVLVGLYHDPDYWEKIRRDPKLVEVYLRRLTLDSLSAAEELAPLVRGHPSFVGWFITGEIDDTSWLEPRAREVLAEYLRELGGSLGELAPGKRIALSGFSNAHMDPRSLQEFWQTLLRETPLDLVLFQDSIGTKKLELDYLPLYLSSLKGAAEANSCDLQVIVEIFDQVSGPPIDERAFEAVPAPLERIARQSKLAASYSTSGIVAFSVPEYMTPFGGREAERLFESYIKGR